MKLKHAQITSFAKITNSSFDFADGINIIMGNNEAGKSSLLAFIRFMLFGLSTKADRELYANFDTGTCIGSLVLEAEGKEYRIERRASLESAREQVQVIDLSDGSVLRDVKKPGEYFLGVDENVFLQSCLLAQLGTLEVGYGDIMQSIENILFSGDEDINVKKARKKLDSARVALLHKNAKGGKIAEMSDKSDELALSAREAEGQNIRIRQMESSLRSMKEKRDCNREQKTVRREMLDAAAALSMLGEYQKRCELSSLLQKAERDLSSLTDNAAQNNINAEYANEEFLSSLKNASLEYEFAKRAEQEALSEYRQSEAEFEKSTESFADVRLEEIPSGDVISDLSAKKSRGRLFSLACGVFAGLTFISALCGMLFRSVLSAVLAPVIIICALSGATALFFALMAKSSKDKQKALLARYSAKNEDELERLISDAHSKKSVLQGQQSILENAKAKHSQKLSLLNEKKAELFRLASKALLDTEKETSPEQIEAGLMHLCEERSVLLARIDKYTLAYKNINLPQDFSPEAAAAFAESAAKKYEGVDLANCDTALLKRELDFYSQSSEMLSEKIAENEKQLAALLATAKDPAELLEAQAAIRDRIEKLSVRHSALVAADECLDRASKNLEGSISPRLCALAGEHMRVLTSGKYDTLGFNDDYSLNYFDGTHTHALKYLSQGTKDAAYISLRLALAELLYKKTLPPLLFDESFARLDKERLLAVLSLLCKNEDKFQSFIFTCHEREAELIGTVGKANILNLSL